MRINELKDPKPGAEKGIIQDNSKSSLLKKIASECSDYISVIRPTHLILFRGLSSDHDAFLGTPRNDRTPKDSAKSFQASYDNMLRAKGFTALRSNSIFCTSDYSQAEQYGDEVYVIFPRNGFSFTWSETRADVNVDTVELLDYIPEKSGEVKKRAFLRKFNDWGKNKFKKWYDLEVNRNWNLNSYEIEAVEHVAHFTRWPVPKEALAFIDSIGMTHAVSPALLYKEFKPSNKNLPKALYSEHEICIHGSYYAVKATMAGALCEQLGLSVSELYKHWDR